MNISILYVQLDEHQFVSSQSKTHTFPNLKAYLPDEKNTANHYRPYLPIRHAGGHMGGLAPDLDDPSSFHKTPFFFNFNSPNMSNP